MYKIFVDTNVILNFYRVDNKKSINDILKEIKKYKKHFVSTQQSKDEFLRNRERTIRDFVEEIKEQTYKAHNNSIVSTLDEYEEYAKSIAKANNNTKIIIDEINKLKENPEMDLIYEIFLNLNEVIYKRTSKIIERASKRKVTGNPPTSNKYTCGDEIIWETLLEYCDNDLIIVSKDSTFKDNYQFLSNEFKEKKRKKTKNR